MRYKKSQYCIPIEKIGENVIIYNTLTGGIIEVEKEVSNVLLSYDEFDNNILFFDSLLAEGYIVPKDKNEYLALRYHDIFIQNNVLGLESLTFVIAPTTACNLNCLYCFEHEKVSTDRPNADTISAIAEFIFQQCKKYSSVKKVHITWFGGEPLLCYDEIIQMGKIIKLKLHSINVSLDSSIVTNGVLFSRERVVGLKENCSLSSVQISLDGLEDEYCKKKNCSIQVYERLMRNIKEIRPLIKLCIRLNTDKNNLKDMYALADYFYDDFNPSQEFKLYFAMLRDYSYGTIKNIPFFSLVEYQEEKRKFYNYLIEKGYIAKERNEQDTVPIHKPIYCNLSRVSNYAIGPKGELYKCEHHFGQKDKIIGDVVNGLYYNEFYFEQMYHTHDQLCEKCSLYPICQTSCPEIRKLVQVVNGRCMRYDQVYQRVTTAVKQYLSSE